MRSAIDHRALLERVKGLGGETPNPRVKHMVDRLLDVVYPLVVELGPTEEEWSSLIAHLDRTGREGQFDVTCWLLGLSQLVQDMNSPLHPAATEPTILGPFYKPGAPRIDRGGSLCKQLTDADEYCVMEGTVRDLDGNGVAGVEIDVWGANSEGRYSFWDDDQPPFNLRGEVETGADGRYAFMTAYPRPYAIPPFLAPGAMLAALGRQAWRPSHLHFQLRKPGFEPLVTQVYFADSDFLGIDSAVGVKTSLVAGSRRIDDADALASRGLDRPAHMIEFDFVLQPSVSA